MKYIFFAQINLSEIKSFFISHKLNLPEKGMFYIFKTFKGNLKFKFTFYDVDMSDLYKTEFPKWYPKEVNRDSFEILFYESNLYLNEKSLFFESGNEPTNNDFIGIFKIKDETLETSQVSMNNSQFKELFNLN